MGSIQSINQAIIAQILLAEQQAAQAAASAEIKDQNASASNTLGNTK